MLLTAVDKAVAQTAAVIDGLPSGVIIYDAETTPEAVPETEVGSESTNTSVVVPDEVAPVTQSPASVRSPALPAATEVLTSGTAILDPTTIAPQVDLAPGETVIQVIATPSIVKIPAPEPAYTITSFPTAPVQRTPPPPKVDPVTGRLRDTPGWTGRREGPASIGCFPEGACAVLNSR